MQFYVCPYLKMSFHPTCFTVKLLVSFKSYGRESLKFSPDVRMNYASLTPGVFTHEQITHMGTYLRTHIFTHREPANVLDESVGNKVHPHSHLMASHPPRPSEQYSEIKYGQEF